MKRKIKKTILIDLDGVLNTYTGNYNENYIPPIKKGAKEFLEKLAKDYTVHIFTTRKPELVVKWSQENNIYNFVEDIKNFKIWYK